MPESFSSIEVSYARRILAAYGVPAKRQDAHWLANPKTGRHIAFIAKGFYSNTLFDRRHADRVRVARAPTEIVNAESILLAVIAAHDPEAAGRILLECFVWNRTWAKCEILAQAQAKLESLGIDVTTV